MKTGRLIVTAVMVCLLFAGLAFAKDACTTIQSGELVTSYGEPITVGFNQWGYNYQARLFNGMYCDSYQGAAWCQEYSDVTLKMKWNDAWMSNKDCDGDLKLDRHFGYPTYKDSGAWLTNHQSWPVDVEVENEAGEIELVTVPMTATYFCKIVAVRSSDVLTDGIYYTSDGLEIGPAIWGQFAIIQEEIDDPSDPDALDYVSPAGPGLGKWAVK